MPVLSKRIVLDCFYLLIFYSEKFSTDVCRLPYAVNVNLNLSILEHTLTRLRVGLNQSCVELHSGNAFGGELDPVFHRNLAIANKRSDSMPSIDSVLHVCVTSKWLMLA